MGSVDASSKGPGQGVLAFSAESSSQRGKLEGDVNSYEFGYEPGCLRSAKGPTATVEHSVRGYFFKTLATSWRVTR